MRELLGFLLFLGLWYLLHRYQMKRGAKNIIKTQKAIYSTQHEYRRITPEEFPFLDRQFYDDVRKWLEQDGFDTLGDYENVTLTAAMPKMRSFLRSFSGDRGNIIAACYHFRNRGFSRFLLRLFKIPSSAKVVEFETEFTDGSFLLTGNSLEMDRTGPVPGLKRVQLPMASPWPDILAAHRRQLQIDMGLNPDLKPRPLRTVEDVIAAQHRQQEIKNRHKKSIGYMDTNELRHIAGDRLANTVESTMKEVDKLKEKETAESERTIIR